MLDPSSRHLLGFIDAYFKNDDTLTKRVVILLYFSFTSLTTVGFGDFVPKSDFERIFTALLIFSGVGVFSFFVGNFALALDGFYRLQNDFDEGEDLFKFFGLIKNFNSGNNLKKKIVKDIENYFEYRWQNDKNQAIRLEEDVEILNQMPINVQI